MFNLVNFLSYIFVTGITPGPNNLMSMSNAARFGFKKTLPFNIGVFVGFSIITVACAIFGNILSTIIPVIKLPMLILGAIYMLYLAYITFRSAFIKKDTKDKTIINEAEKEEVEAIKDEDSGKNLFISAILLQFVNVKVYIYAIVSIEAYIIPAYAGNYPKLIFYAFFLSFFGFWCTICWSVFGSAFNVLFSKYAKITNTIMALLLVYCAISLFF